jgi:hypothetical protein
MCALLGFLLSLLFHLSPNLLDGTAHIRTDLPPFSFLWKCPHRHIQKCSLPIY